MNVNNCYLCNYNKSKTLYIKNNFTIVRCNNCEFIYVLEKLDKNIIEKYYNNFDYKSIIEAEKTIRKDTRRSCDVLDRLINNRGRLFDVGCGRGFFLEEAKSRGWTVFGIDRSASMVSYARKKLHLNVIQGDIRSYKNKDRFDLVTLHQVIEHFEDPVDLLKNCYKLLNRGGYIYIATPNINSASSRIQKERFDYLIPPEHLSFFSEKTLKIALKSVGFDMKHIDFWSYPADLGGIIKTVIGKRTLKTEKVLSLGFMSNRMNNQIDLVKRVKSFLFDDIFCQLFYPVLNLDSWGTNLEVVAQKP